MGPAEEGKGHGAHSPDHGPPPPIDHGPRRSQAPEEWFRSVGFRLSPSHRGFGLLVRSAGSLFIFLLFMPKRPQVG